MMVMPRKKTYQQKEREIKAYSEKKRKDLRTRISKKYDEKAVKEYNRKVKRIEQEEERKLHNLKIEEWKAHPNAKVKIKKPRSTDYKNACDLAQLIAKLRDTNEMGEWSCICCPWSLFDREQLDWGHYIAKAKSRATAIDLRNVNWQSKVCNSKFWWSGRYDAQTPQIDLKRWKGTVEELHAKMERREKIYPKQFIIENIPLARKLLSEKTFDVSKYYKMLERLENRYVKY